MRSKNIPLVLILVAALAGVPAAGAEEVTMTYDFDLHEWHAIDKTDGPVTLHRIRLDPKEGRFTKTVLARPYNQEYLETIRIQLEYTNESAKAWDARLTVRWHDQDGELIDGISGNEKLKKKRARETASLSVATLKYGLAHAKTLEVTVHFKP